jgi:hypothetical protein
MRAEQVVGFPGVDGIPRGIIISEAVVMNNNFGSSGGDVDGSLGRYE